MAGTYTPGQPYAVAADLPVLGGISAAALSSPNTGAAQQTACLLTASEYVDTFLCDRFTLPLTQWGSDIKRAVCVLAAWDLICIRGYNPANDSDRVFEIRCKQATDWLKLVAQGSVTPNVTDSSPNAAARVPAPNAGPVVSSPNPCTRDTSRR